MGLTRNECKVLACALDTLAECCDIISSSGACDKCPLIGSNCLDTESLLDVANTTSTATISEFCDLADDIETICDPLGESYERAYREHADELAIERNERG